MNYVKIAIQRMEEKVVELVDGQFKNVGTKTEQENLDIMNSSL